MKIEETPVSTGTSEKGPIEPTVPCTNCTTSVQKNGTDCIGGTDGTDGTVVQLVQSKYKEIYNNLSNDLKIVYSVLDDWKIISVISIDSKIDSNTVRKIISRSDSKNDLVDRGLIEKDGSGPAKFKATAAGIRELEFIYKEEERKKENEKIEREAETKWKADIQSKIKACKEFIEEHYYHDLLEANRKGLKSLNIDFKILAKFEPQFTEWLLDDPLEVFKCFEISIEAFDLTNSIKGFKFRFFNLPKDQKVLLRNIRKKHMGKLYAFEGTVIQKSKAGGQVTSARFECQSCGNIIPVLQLEPKFKQPSKCGCGRKGKFRLISEEKIDIQHLKFEELTSDLEGYAQPININVFFKEDLTYPKIDKNTQPGSPLKLVGIITKLQLSTKQGQKTTSFEYFIETNSIEFIENKRLTLKITKEDEKEIHKVSKDKELYPNMIDSICPAIKGYREIKEALLLQLLGGVKIETKDSPSIRGDIHILLVGDAGKGKTQMIKRMAKIAPIVRSATGKGASGVGLTATPVKDEFTEDWALRAGAVVLASGGLVTIDELDKINRKDTDALHEPLEDQTVSISKATIQATLKAETACLAGANPKFGRFDSHTPTIEQITLPLPLITRFDLIFPIKDIPNEKEDKEIAEHITSRYKQGITITSPYSTEFIKKYIAFAKKNYLPELSDESDKIVKKYYLYHRKNLNKGVPITPRYLLTLVRLTLAAAKFRLSNITNKEDAKRAVKILDYCFKCTIVDQESGEYDFDIISDTPSAQRSKIMIIKEIINDLESKIGRTLPLTDIEEIAKEKGLSENEVTEVLEKLQHSGDIFEPKRGFIQKI